MAVDVLVQKIAKGAGARSVAGLGAEGAQPHEITGLDLYPVLVQLVDGLALQHIEPVFHDMGLLERDHAAGLKCHDRDMHIVAQVVGVDKAGCRPGTVGVGHRGGLYIGVAGDKGGRRGKAGGRFIEFADQVKARRGVVGVFQTPFGAGWQIGVGAGANVIFLAVDRQPDLAFGQKQYGLGARVRLRRVRAAARCHLHHILAEGLGKTRHRTRDQPEAGSVPSRQKAGDDIGKHAARQEGIGLGKDRAACHQLCLGWQPPFGGVIAAHVSISFRRNSAMRSTCWQAVANSVSVSLPILA